MPITFVTFTYFRENKCVCVCVLFFYWNSTNTTHFCTNRETQECIVEVCDSNLVEEGTVCDRKSKSIEAHSQHHVIWGIITVALTAAVQKPNHSLPAEHHPAATHTHTSHIWNILDTQCRHPVQQHCNFSF